MAVRDVVQAAAGSGGGGPEYVEDVFSTYLYRGNGSTQTITNGIDLAGEGGLVWQKVRSSAGYRHFLFDTERAFNNYISSNTADVQSSLAALSSFNSDGVTLTSDGNVNGSGIDSVLWTFRKSPNFFDVVTWTGNSTPRTISHNLGSVPGCIFVKRLDGLGSDWNVYHRSLGNSARLLLNATAQAYDVGNVCWNSTDPTDTVFSLGTNSGVNTNGATYVAYLFAHDAGGFSEEEDQNIISCGSYTATGNDDIELGFEPQWILHKRANTDSAWYIQDVQRGMALTQSKHLSPNTATAEGTFSGNITSPTATGFHNGLWGSGTIIYIAIRRPMKTPESGTEVFAIDTAGGTAPNPPLYNAGFPVDMAIFALELSTSFDNRLHTRLLGETSLATNSTRAEAAATEGDFDYQDGWNSDVFTNATYISWMFKRAPSVFDVVCYTGTSVAHTEAHNLGVAPELMIVKNRTNGNGNQNWQVYSSTLGASARLQLNSTDPVFTGTFIWNHTAPTSSVFSLSTSAFVNGGSDTYVAYLFASLPNISKVSSYTGTGADLNVDCGFSAGARFILIKRTDASGDWYVWDSLRGITAGNDPYLLLNSTAAEVTSTDYIDPLSSGFTVTSNASSTVNVNTGTYIFLAIA